MANSHERLAELQAVGRLMADPAGRRWLYNFLASCSVYASNPSTNALRMAFIEGQRDVGLHLTAETLEANAEGYLQMLREMSNERPRKPHGTDADADASADDTDATA